MRNVDHVELENCSVHGVDFPVIHLLTDEQIWQRSFAFLYLCRECIDSFCIEDFFFFVQIVSSKMSVLLVDDCSQCSFSMQVCLLLNFENCLYAESKPKYSPRAVHNMLCASEAVLVNLKRNLRHKIIKYVVQSSLNSFTYLTNTT